MLPPSLTSVSNVPSPGLGNRVKLIKEEDAGSSCPGLVKHIPHISLTLPKPHSQQFRSLGGGRGGRGRLMHVIVS